MDSLYLDVGGSPCGRCHAGVPDDYATIQSAIDAASSGDTVRIRPGRYSESLTFKSGIRLEGETRDDVVIQCDAAKSPVLQIADCPEGTVAHLTFEHAKAEKMTAHIFENASLVLITGSSVEVVDCVMQNGASYGLKLTEGGEATIRDCVIRKNGRTGIAVYGSDIRPTLVGNRCIDNERTGIYFWGDLGTAGTVERNVCARNAWNGIAVSGTKCRPNLRNNTLIENGFNGLSIDTGAEPRLEDNVIRNNRGLCIAEVAPLLADAKFDELEAMAARLRKEKLRTHTGDWHLRRFYGHLHYGWDNVRPRNRARYAAVLGKWKEAHPDSVTQRIAYAYFHTRWAWDERGGGWASKVTPDGWKGFREHQQLAWGALVEAEELGAQDPHLYTLFVELAMGLGKDSPAAPNGLVEHVFGTSQGSTELEQLFKKAVAVEPLYTELYEKMTLASLPRWGGSPEKVVQLADQAAKNTRHLEGERLYAVVAYETLQFEEEYVYLNGYSFSWERIRQGYLDHLERFPTSHDLRNQFCYTACLHRDKQTAAEQFALIPHGFVTPSVWGTERSFHAHKEWALEDGPYPQRQVPLVDAIRDQNRARITALLASTEDVNICDARGRTPISAAAKRNDALTVAELIKKGADPNLNNDVDYPLIYSVVRNRNGTILDMLFDAGVDLNVKGPKDWTPLQLATFDGDLSLVTALLDHGANPDLPGYYGGPAAFQALLKGNLPLLELLLERGADPNAVIAEGTSLLQAAAERGQIDMIPPLISKGADVGYQEHDGWSALHSAAYVPNPKAMEALLASPDCDLTITSSSGQTPLHAAAKKGFARVVEVLLDHGAEINPLDTDGMTPLALAEKRGHAKTAELLQQRGGTK